MTQQFWSAQYASANTATSSFATKYMADVPDVDVKMQARNGSYKHGKLRRPNQKTLLKKRADVICRKVQEEFLSALCRSCLLILVKS
ncbi:unnamed protein product [Pocillopora meandrina]|uniref:Uncharacterized protein n=1 Tax=Pocillopora meandrina TaxID=46732 RepID=A0AAU9WNW8_9CNID|nr:unnamed protein product [Pocillopora meandrina]